MKIDPRDTALSQHDQQVALVLMNALMASVGDRERPEVTAKDLHRVLALMSAIVLETDASLTAPSHFREAGAYCGELVALFAKVIRDEHERTGVSMMDLAVASGGAALN